MRSLINGLTARNILFLTFAIGLFVYVVLRAYYLSFTHDESLSYEIIMGDAERFDTANNHFINTYLMTLCNNIFGNSEFSLRLPNIFSFVLYSLGCFYILRQSRKWWLVLFGLTILLLNPFLIDFFSLARGYGLSMGFMMLSLLFLLKNTSNHENYKAFLRNYSLSIIFGCLAVFSNLALINYYIVIIVIYKLHLIFGINSDKGSSLKFKISFILLMLLSFIILYFGIKRLLFLDSLGRLYFGESTLTASVETLIKDTLYFSDYGEWLVGFLKYLMLISILAGIILIVIKKDFFSEFSMLTLLIILLVVILLAEHNLFGSLYPSGRTALMFVPLFGLFYYYLIVFILKEFKLKTIYLVISIFIIIVPICTHFLLNANLQYTKSWKYDAHTKDAMKIVYDYSKELAEGENISNNWLFTPSINYYIDSRKMNLNFANREGTNSNSKFIYDFGCRQDSLYRYYVHYDDIDTYLMIK